MFAEAASPFGRLVGFMFSLILRFASRTYAGRGYTREDALKRFSHDEGGRFRPKKVLGLGRLEISLEVHLQTAGQGCQ